MTDNTAVTWKSEPPKECQLCHRPITNTFIDGRTIYGPWACMCESCLPAYGVGLGHGRGQKFRRTTARGKVWHKVEG